MKSARRRITRGTLHKSQIHRTNALTNAIVPRAIVTFGSAECRAEIHPIVSRYRLNHASRLSRRFFSLAR